MRPDVQQPRDCANRGRSFVAPSKYLTNAYLAAILDTRNIDRAHTADSSAAQGPGPYSSRSFFVVPKMRNVVRTYLAHLLDPSVRNRGNAMATDFRSSFDATKALASEARWDDVAQALAGLQASTGRNQGDVAEGPLVSYLRTAEEAARNHDGGRVLHNLQRAERFLP